MERRAGASKGIGLPETQNASQKSLGTKISKLGAKFAFYLFALRENKRIKLITEILGGGSKKLGENSSWAFHSSTSISVE